MALLSNSLYLDSEYKADCEYKINYLSFLETNKLTRDLENVQDEDDNPKDNDYLEVRSLESLETKLIKAEADEKPFVSDGQFLYSTKQISNNYYKILIENH